MTSIFSPVSGTTDNWLASTWVDIQNSQNSAGIMGALGTAASSKNKPGSIAAFLNNNSGAGTDFATITQNSTVNATQLALQISDSIAQAAADAAVQKALKELSQISNTVQPKNVLDPVIFFENGSTLDTNSNILTLSNGDQFDSVTGAPYTDPASIMQLANGAYLDTVKNIMTMPDGTRIDTVTGLVLSTSA